MPFMPETGNAQRIGRDTLVIIKRSILLLLGLAGMSGLLWAEQIRQREDIASWTAQTTLHRCGLEQVINDFGKVRLLALPAHPLQLQLETGLALASSRVAALLVTPPWRAAQKPEQSQISLQLVRATESQRVYQADGAEAVLQALSEGWQVMLPLAKVGHPEPLQLVLQPVRLQAALQEFRSCQLQLVAEKPKKTVVHVHQKPTKAKLKKAPSTDQAKTGTGKGMHDTHDPIDKDKPSVQSPYQDWLKHHESSRHALDVTRGHNGKSLSKHLTLMFAPGKPNISKALQDDMESMVKEWEIRQGEGRTMSLLIEEDATPDQFNLTRERLDAIHAYLLARGLSPSRVHMRIRRVASSSNPDQVDVSIGD